MSRCQYTFDTRRKNITKGKILKKREENFDLNYLKKMKCYITKNSNIYKNKTQSKTAQNKQRERNLKE